MLDYTEVISSLKKQLADEIKLSKLNKEYIIFLEDRIEVLEKINLSNIEKIKEYEEKISELEDLINKD